ncbi:hypothetical protein CFP65_1453 [Kitasatospora sp. MMS16-BH015]|uniref:DUF4082 domain-containing protein n=1 Tax=Kitasatospora sp. MMS16-BH015 TaxID=2018025 RepID=UPI000CA2CF33|nr:DUF4082 domain-containing protein [Kitasatospora sp. MMS16-BH015]AUG76351.1 hypothetical protein CFP65_1453 [Kitasatospora sp. MMS16-BH015]
MKIGSTAGRPPWRTSVAHRIRAIGRFPRALLAGVLLLGATTLTALPAHAAGDPCATPVVNKVACENSKPGDPVSDWYSPNAWGAIQGFTAHESYKPGDTVEFKVNSPTAYQIEIYRLGWYQGNRARKMPSSPTATYPAKTQPNCLSDASTGLVDCGNWTTTVTWQVPADAVSGLYLANIQQADGSGLMPYPIIIRDESSHSDVVVQTSDQTWQAYNQWGGQNLYNGSGPAPDGRAYKVSYNRPLDIGADNGIYGSEYSMIGWLERNGYDVSYLSGIDVSTKGVLLQNHKVFLSNGHDEYWNQAQRDNVTAARAAGVNLAFFSANEMFWRTRFENSIDASGTSYRTLVCYKETKLQIPGVDGVPDPSGQWTGTWMDPVGAGRGGGKPQNALTGQLFQVNGYRNDAMTVPAAFGKLRFWRNTSITTLPAGQVATFPTGTLGYEWDSDVDNGFRPPGAIDLSSTTVAINDGNMLQDNGNTYANGVATHSPTLYRDPSSGALVFGAGTVQWSWGLDTLHVGNTTTEDPRMQQATVNLLADMGAQPTTLQSGLTAAAASTETGGPTVLVSAPASGATVPVQKPVTVSGTAADLGFSAPGVPGVVARVEVSVDGGTTWKGATGTTTWSYTWTPLTQGPTQILVRGVNDSVRNGTTVTVPLTVGPQQCPCTVWPSSAVPAHADSGDAGAIELGVKFRTTVNGSVTGVRFYKSALNTGTHTGSLWASDGTLLGTGTFTGETASGWQQLTFAQPVPVKANTTYIASYYAPNGHYSYDDGYFTGQGAGIDPIKALMAGADGDNALYRYNTGGGFPNSSYHSSNYWVDAVLDTSANTTIPPAVTAVTPVAGSTGVAITASPTATFNHTIDSKTLNFTLTGGGGAVSAAVSYDTATATATLRPNGQLALGTTYTATVSANDPWGNTMAAPKTWSFTTSPTPPTVTCPCTLWNSATAPASLDSGDATAVELGTRFTPSINGWITGVRFYKSVANTGTHTGTLWSNTGTQLATGSFSGETASGWQQLTFTTPVAVTAGTNYVVSYFAPKGHYSGSNGYFANGYSNYPLRATPDATGSANGIYKYGATGFPTSTFNSTNYWVDPVFTNVRPAGAPVTSLQLPLLDSLLTPLEKLLGGLLGVANGPTTATPGSEPTS